MVKIDINSIPEEFHTINLKNNKTAVLYKAIWTKVPEINNDENITIYHYNVPCPLCNTPVDAFSYDGKFFGNMQLNCRCCGIYFRPVVEI